MYGSRLLWVVVLGLGVLVCDVNGQTPSQKTEVFDRIELTDTYYSEGIATGDVNGDGHVDVVYGPHWYSGPNWKDRHEIYPAKAQPRQRYADHFFAWLHDFNGDGLPDLLTGGFPGTPGYVYENPGKTGFGKAWRKHQVIDEVSHESPQLIDINGDGQRDLVFSQAGKYGFASYDSAKPFAKWKFTAISARKAPKPFGHGLGVGDINGDGRQDFLIKDGWFEHPNQKSSDWVFHPYQFAARGGAEMHVYDVDGDGDGDVISSLQAHDYGLAWFEQFKDQGKITFRRHLIMGTKPEENRYGVLFTELHSVQLADIDGDGLKDIVTGKTYWSHHTQSPMWDAGAVVYWFKLVRSKEGVDWVPFLADGDSGIGRQIVVADVDGNGLDDILTGGMKGGHLLRHDRRAIDAIMYDRMHPRRFQVLAADGMSGAEAAAAMSLPPGFHSALAAGEPQVHQPIAFTIDSKGRLWVAEAYNYPERAPQGQGKDRIVILEDSNGDGKLDKRKVFIEKLNLVSGLEVGFGGVWVGAAPYLMFIPDDDGDDEPDGPPRILLDGFGYQDTHEVLNSFIWGPDGWLYGCQGVFTHSKVGSPGTADEDRVPMNAGVWRYHPTRHKFEVFAWGTSNPWGVDFNDLGEAFATACVIPHLFHVIPGARYRRQAGRHFNRFVFDDIKTIADHAHYAGRINDHAWWGHEPTQLAPDTSAAGGGHAHCGAMIYLGGAFPEAYRGQIFFNNIHGNRVNMDILQRRGSGYVGQHGPDFMLANDHWFRGINLKYGPAGSVYLIDWYDRNACHRRNPEIWDRTNGRIYHLWYGNRTTVQVDLEQQSDLELVDFQLHDNDWFVRTARQILQHRSANGNLEEGARTKLRELVKSDLAPPKLLRVIWTLAAVGEWDTALAASLFSHPNESVRSWSVRLSVQEESLTPQLKLAWLKEIESGSSAKLRLAVASALPHIPLKERWEFVAQLLAHEEDREDPNIPYLVWFAAEPLVPLDAVRAMELALDSKLPQVAQWIVQRAASSGDHTEAVVRALGEQANPATRQWILEALLAAFAGQADLKAPNSWGRTFEQLMAGDSEVIKRLAERVAVALGDRRIFPQLRMRAVDPSKPNEERTAALQILIAGRDPDLRPTLLKLLAEPDFRGQAIRSLARLADHDVAQTLLAMYSKLNSQEQQDALLTMSATRPAAKALVAAMKAGSIDRKQVHAFHVRQIAALGDSELRTELENVWGKLSDSSAEKRRLIREHQRKLRPVVLQRANLGNGRRLFDKTCASCHMLFGTGGKVGPDLTGANRANLDYVLENIVDPSAVLGKDYRMTLLQLDSGRLVSGLIQDESESAVTMVTLNETVVVPKSEINQRKLSDLSMMPEKLLEPLTADEVRDLVGYLGSPRQVALRGPSAVIDQATGRVSDAWEGEAMTVLKPTVGQARSQDMESFSKDRWSGNEQLFWTGAKPKDRLSLEFTVDQSGLYRLELVLTRARDYGIIQLYLDDKKIGSALDLFHSPDVLTTGVLSYNSNRLSAGKHQLTIEVLGAHPEAIKAYMVGLDYVKLVPEKEK